MNVLCTCFGSLYSNDSRNFCGITLKFFNQSGAKQDLIGFKCSSALFSAKLVEQQRSGIELNLKELFRLAEGKVERNFLWLKKDEQIL